jgi:hypothetical protein
MIDSGTGGFTAISADAFTVIWTVLTMLNVPVTVLRA